MKFNKRQAFSARVLAVIVCSLTTWGLVRICTSFVNPMLPPPVAIGLMLLVWGGSTYLFMVNIFPLLDKWLDTRSRSQRKSNRPGEVRYLDYQRPIATHLMPPDAGKCVGFVRLTIFENGFVTDGEYIPAEMVYNLASALSANPHLASEFSSAVMAQRLFVDGKMRHPYVFFEKIMEAIKETCPCELCSAKRAEASRN